MFIRKAISLLCLTWALTMMNTGTAFAVDFNNYDVDGKELLGSQEIFDINWYLDRIPDYVLNEYFSKGYHMEFKSGYLKDTDTPDTAMACYYLDNKEINIRTDLENVKGFTFGNKGIWMGRNMIHELGHYYYDKYKSQLSDEAKEQMHLNYINRKDWDQACYNENETFATCFAQFYESCYHNNLEDLPYRELDNIISGGNSKLWDGQTMN